MPCYLFTYHAYGTWMPDRARGYVKRKQGILNVDVLMAEKYLGAMKDTAVAFETKIQGEVINVLLESSGRQVFDLHFIATDRTHVHVLLAWRDARKWLRMRSVIKSSLSRHLNNQFE